MGVVLAAELLATGRSTDDMPAAGAVIVPPVRLSATSRTPATAAGLVGWAATDSTMTYMGRSQVAANGLARALTAHADALPATRQELGNGAAYALAMLLGRSAETARLLALIENARRGESSSLVIRGEAGVGKTSLLTHATAMAGDLTQLLTRGLEAESSLPYVGLADLFRPVIRHIDRVPGRQAAALSGALAIGPAVTGDSFAVAAATLSLLGTLAEERPVLVTVDDAQWLDSYSLDALAFASRRLSREGVLVLFAVRDDPEAMSRLTGLEVLTLRGLDREAARRLLAVGSAAGLGPADMDKLILETAGNPLALIELPALLNKSQLLESIRMSEPVPVGDVLARAFGRAVEAIPSESQDALLLLAMLGSAPVEVTEAALRILRLSIEALGPAEAAGLIIEENDCFVFRHPLVRAAVHRGAIRMRRNRAHRAVAQALEQVGTPQALERRAWHLAAAGGGPDKQLATELDSAANASFGRSNYALASRLYERAAQFTTDRRMRATRLSQAALAAEIAGALDEAAGLLDRALESTTDSVLLLNLRHQRCLIDMWRGEMVRSRELLVSLAAEAEMIDPPLQPLLLADATLTNLTIGDVATAKDISARAMALTEGSAAPNLSVQLLRALVLLLVGDADEGLALLEAVRVPLESWNPLDPRQLQVLGGLCYLAAERLDEAHAVFERATSAARNAGAIGILPFSLIRLSMVEYWRGRWDACLALADEAVRLAVDSGWRTELSTCLAALARIEAARGRRQECHRHAREAVRAAELAGLDYPQAYAATALGLLALGGGRFNDAALYLEKLRDLFSADGPLLAWAADLAEVYIRLERHDDAREVINVLERESRRGHRPMAAAAAARCRGLLAADDFESHFSAAMVQHSKLDVPFERARTELCLGEQLRRRGRRVEARKWLTRCLMGFEQLGAVDWAERAAAELRAAGGAQRDRADPASAALSPQELQVALAVARGATNQEAAAKLFLSVKTVEFHLGNAYRKLRISRRAQLARLFADR